MDGFKKVLREVNLVVDEILAFDIILTSVVIFLAFYLGLMLLSLNPWYSLFPTLAYLAFLLYVDLNTNKYKMVEAKYAPLYEELRTAADNVDNRNMVVEELEEEVISNLRNVRVSSFVKIKRISSKVLGAVILCLIILYVSMYDVSFGDWGHTFEEIRDLIYKEGGAGSGGKPGDELVSGKDGDGDEIYGEESMARVGNQDLEIRIKQASLEIIGSEMPNIPDKEFEETFPEEIFVTSEGSYEEKITIENQKLVRDYFKELSKS